MQSTPDRLVGMDFAAHNAEVRAMWEALHAGKPYRVPIVLGTNSRYFMFHPGANPEGLGFQEYSEDPDVMYEAQLRFSWWSKHNLLQDAELGVPERWGVGVDFQNYYEAAWFGCPVEYMSDQVPDTRPVFADCPERVMEHGLPDPFEGLFAKGRRYYEHMKERAKREGFMDRPVDVWVPGAGTDGPMTVACNLFGPDFVCEAMIEEPKRLHELLDFITEAIIRRMSAWRGIAGIVGKSDGFFMADDSIALISTPMYVEHVMPFHARIYDAFATAKGRGIHLCGNAQRHFRTIVDSLGVSSFDTGFPIDFQRLRKDLGPDVHISGGPHAEFLRSQTPEAVVTETKRIMESGILKGGRFTLREGNNLAPSTPEANTEAMYHAGRALGALTNDYRP